MWMLKYPFEVCQVNVIQQDLQLDQIPELVQK